MLKTSWSVSRATAGTSSHHASTAAGTGSKFRTLSKTSIRAAYPNVKAVMAKPPRIAVVAEKRAEKALQELTDEHVHKVDEMLKHKEAEILEV